MMHTNHDVSETDRGCGRRLRQAREAAGLSQEDVSARLKMPLRVVQSLENEDWAKLGAPVFVRGQLRSYSRLLGLTTSTTIEASGIAPIEPTALVSRSYTPRTQRLIEQGTRKLVYIVLTAAIAVPVWLATRPHLNNTANSIRSLDAPSAPGTLGHVPQAPVSEASDPNVPLVASIAPMSPRPSAVPALSLRLTADSWVQVIAPDGRTLEQGLLSAGASRSYAAGEVGRVVLGNAAAVAVQQGGRTLDMAPYQRANVARFTVSSDGTLAPVSD